jgi:hypothetical protein
VQAGGTEGGYVVHGADREIQPQVLDLVASEDQDGSSNGSRQTVLNWEPVSGFEPLTCRLQDGCSAN